MAELNTVLSSFLSNATQVPNPAGAASRPDHHQGLSLRTELKQNSLTQPVTDKVHGLSQNQDAT